jgi:hypothetical protein
VHNVAAATAAGEELAERSGTLLEDGDWYPTAGGSDGGEDAGRATTHDHEPAHRWDSARARALNSNRSSIPRAFLDHHKTIYLKVAKR